MLIDQCDFEYKNLKYDLDGEDISFDSLANGGFTLNIGGSVKVAMGNVFSGSLTFSGLEVTSANQVNKFSTSITGGRDDDHFAARMVLRGDRGERVGERIAATASHDHAHPRRAEAGLPAEVFAAGCDAGSSRAELRLHAGENTRVCDLNCIRHGNSCCVTSVIEKRRDRRRDAAGPPRV